MDTNRDFVRYTAEGIKNSDGTFQAVIFVVIGDREEKLTLDGSYQTSDEAFWAARSLMDEMHLEDKGE